MRTTPSTAMKPALRRDSLELQCPECTESVRVARDELVDGSVVHCDSCGADAEVYQELDPRTGKRTWSLVDPLEDFDADEERR